MIYGGKIILKTRFTNILYELIVEKKMKLMESLELIVKHNNNESKSYFERNNIIGKTASFLLSEMLNGTTFANGLKKCPYINFDNIYIAFINYAERTGQINETISFLNKRCIRKKENKYKLFQASLYPFLVIFLATMGSTFLAVKQYFNFCYDTFIYLGLLVFFSFIVFLGIKKTLGENKIYEAFLGIGFLLRAGISLYDAVGCGAQIVGVSSKEGIKFQIARDKLLLGMDIEKAFSLGKKYENAFFYANKTGGKIDVFEKLADWIFIADEKKRKICFSLIEPIFILITGMFLMLIVSNVFLPYISNFNF